MSRGRLAICAVVAAVLLAAPAAARAAGAPAEGLATTLITRSLSGGFPDGASSRPVISLDQRYARVLAFQSAASNLVAPSPGAVSNVYYIVRRLPYDNRGGPWLPGPIELASVGLGGQAADGPSGAPAVSGDNFTAPRCIAFVSAASNLVGGDTNGQPDAFVFELRNRRIVRVSVGSHGGQANGAASAVAVDGACRRVAFVDDATNLARGAPTGVRQVYVRDLLRHRTRIVSSARHGPGNADSFEPAFAARRGQLLFATLATNLDGPTGGFSQVLEQRAAGRHLIMLSRTASGAPGNGNSDEPAIQQYGSGYAFRTRAANLAPGAGHFSQVVHSRAGSALSTAGPPSTGDAADPDVVDLGYYVLFDSADPSLGAPAGSAGSAYLYTAVRNLVIPISVNSAGQRLALPGSDPSSSEAGNYVFFETSDPRADTAFAGLGVTPQQALAAPAYHQIYLRYVGPK
jgi:hypothetical protein